MAGVSCVIIGFHAKSKQTDLLTPNGVCDLGNVNGVSREQIRVLKTKTIYDPDGTAIPATHISGYLIDAPDQYAESRVTSEMRMKIEEAAQAVLDVRKRFMDADPECSLGILYMPDTMPPELLFAHEKLDALVDKAYGLSRSATDAERVAHLFKLHAGHCKFCGDAVAERG